MAVVDSKGGSEPSGAAGEIEKSRGLAVALHKLDAIKGFESANEDRGGGSGGLANDIEHEVRAIVEENVSVAGTEIHRADAWSRATEVMSGGVAGRIGLRFHDTAAEAARKEIVDDDFSDEEASEANGVRWKFGAAQATKCEFLRRGFQSGARGGHRMPNQRESSLCRSSEETRS